ncbi:MAG: hypothetical protein SGI72_08105, partial [Planctomycetota bacterium]|nr:hypothetical protein [Planctomycetota bacterium]
MIRAISIALLTALFVQPGAADIQWQTSFEKTLEKAAAEKRVVFLAVNMDGEKANERMLEKVYTDKEVVELAKLTLNVVASTGEHPADDKPCTKFGGMTCLDHKKVDVAARTEVLKTDALGMTVAPQNVFIGPDGKVILSVPNEINAHELEWCFVTALTKNDPALKLAMPAGAKMPRRLVLGGVDDPKTSPAGALVAPTKKELAELIKTLRKGTLAQDERVLAFARVLLSDDPDALDFVQDEMRSGGAGGGPGAGGGGGGGGRGGGGMGGRGGGGVEKHRLILHTIGAISPVGYWKLTADSLEDHEATIRAEAAVALEQLAAPESTKVLTTLLAKEEDASVAKEMLRALGATGAADPKVRAFLVKQSRAEKNELLRMNAILALGSCDQEAEVKDTLKSLVEKGADKEKTAAVCAMAVTRDAAWMPIIEAATKDTQDAALAKAVKDALTVLKGAELRTIRESLSKIGGDKI